MSYLCGLSSLQTLFRHSFIFYVRPDFYDSDQEVARTSTASFVRRRSRSRTLHHAHLISFNSIRRHILRSRCIASIAQARRQRQEDHRKALRLAQIANDRGSLPRRAKAKGEGPLSRIPTMGCRQLKHPAPWAVLNSTNALARAPPSHGTCVATHADPTSPISSTSPQSTSHPSLLLPFPTQRGSLFKC